MPLADAVAAGASGGRLSPSRRQSHTCLFDAVAPEADWTAQPPWATTEHHSHVRHGRVYPLGEALASQLAPPSPRPAERAPLLCARQCDCSAGSCRRVAARTSRAPRREPHAEHGCRIVFRQPIRCHGPCKGGVHLAMFSAHRHQVHVYRRRRDSFLPSVAALPHACRHGAPRRQRPLAERASYIKQHPRSTLAASFCASTTRRAACIVPWFVCTNSTQRSVGNNGYSTTFCSAATPTGTP